MINTPLWRLDEIVLALGDAIVKSKYRGDTGLDRDEQCYYSVTSDSHDVQDSAIFIGLRGKNFNGNIFAFAALQSGAKLAIIDDLSVIHHELYNKYKEYILFVNNSYDALIKLAKFARQRLPKAQVIAITGSAGKTTTKEMIRYVLSDDANKLHGHGSQPNAHHNSINDADNIGNAENLDNMSNTNNITKAHRKVFATKGNKNNTIGVPLMLVNCPNDADFVVLELAMSNKGEIRFLSSLVLPHIAIITNIFACHMQSFQNIDEIALAKAEILENIVEGGKAILNADSRYYDKFKSIVEKRKADVISFGESSASMMQVISYSESVNKDYSDVQVSYMGERIDYKTEFCGKYLIYNSLIALLIDRIYGDIKCNNSDGSGDSSSNSNNKRKNDVAEEYGGFLGFKPLTGRGNINIIIVGNNSGDDGESGNRDDDGGSDGSSNGNGGNSSKILLIDDSYNANYEAVIQALLRASSYKKGDGGSGDSGGRLIAILGDMLGLGMHEKELHRLLGENITKNFKTLDLLFTVGELMQKYLVPEITIPVTSFADSGAAARYYEDKKQELFRDGDVVLVKGSRDMHMEKVVSSILSN